MSTADSAPLPRARHTFAVNVDAPAHITANRARELLDRVLDLGFEAGRECDAQGEFVSPDARDTDRLFITLVKP